MRLEIRMISYELIGRSIAFSGPFLGRYLCGRM